MVSTYAFLIESGYEPAKSKNKAIELKPNLESLIDQAVSFYDELLVR